MRHIIVIIINEREKWDILSSLTDKSNENIHSWKLRKSLNNNRTSNQESQFFVEKNELKFLTWYQKMKDCISLNKTRINNIDNYQDKELDQRKNDRERIYQNKTIDSGWDESVITFQNLFVSFTSDSMKFTNRSMEIIEYFLQCNVWFQFFALIHSMKCFENYNDSFHFLLQSPNINHTKISK